MCTSGGTQPLSEKISDIPECYPLHSILNLLQRVVNLSYSFFNSRRLYKSRHFIVPLCLHYFGKIDNKSICAEGWCNSSTLLGPSTASIYTTKIYSNVLRDHMAGLPIPTLSPIENILALRSHMRGSIFQHSPSSPQILSTSYIVNSIVLLPFSDSFFSSGHSLR